jgi:VWFA-related protein
MWSRFFHTRSAFAYSICVCVIAATIPIVAQNQGSIIPQKPDAVVVTTGEVLLDAVVRDKKGRLIRDLGASDFEIYEDGVRQEISSFKFISNSTTEKDPDSDNVGNEQSKQANQQGLRNDSQPTKSARDKSEPQNVSAIALVFDRLTPEARARATQAALNFMQESTNKEELYGVFLTDLSVAVLQPFTEDRQLVKLGIEKAGVHSASLYTSNNEKARKARQEATAALLRSQMGGEQRSGGGAPTQNMLEWLEEMERDEQGDATTRGLLFVASLLRSFPGRKAVIFFSEGLILPPSVMGSFDAVINAANRNNVSFYTIDAAGLRVESKTAETTREITSRADLRIAQSGNKAEPSGPMTKGLERNEDLLRLNPDSGLGRLADQTGGFLITDSNDLKGKLRKVDDDLHSYYLLSYRSKNQAYDGHFRRIEIKVKRSGVDVQSRKGYFGIKNTFTSPVLSYEAPALAALENQPKSNMFPFYAAGFGFPERDRPGLAAILVDVPLSAFTFRVNDEKKMYETDFSIITLVKDSAGQRIGKVSKQYRLSGPLDKLDETKQSRVLFYRETDLEFGMYTLETIAYDAPTGHASVRTGTIEVSGSDEAKLRLSDVVILKRAESARSTDEEQTNPFHVGNVIVSPNLGEPLQRSLKQMTFFFTVYPRLAASTQPKLTIELLQQGHTLARLPGELPAADALGRIQYLAGLPLEKIPAGEYELRIVVNDETTRVSRSVHFTVQD